MRSTFAHPLNKVRIPETANTLNSVVNVIIVVIAYRYDDILTDLLVFCLDTLEAERPPPSRSRNLIGYDRHVLLRAVPTLLVLATPTERQGDKLGRRLHPTRCQALFRVSGFHIPLYSEGCKRFLLVV